MANFGFANNKTTSFYIDNKIGDVVINNTLYVNGSLYVNGNDIDKRYVKVSDYDTAINKRQMPMMCTQRLMQTQHS